MSHPCPTPAAILNALRLKVLALREASHLIRNFYREQPRGPYLANIAVTGRCNLACPMCWRKMGDTNQADLPVDKIREILRQLKSIGTKKIYIPGSGEPLMREDIDVIINCIKDLGFEAGMTTNGTLLTESLARLLAARAWDQLDISLDGAEEAVNARTRGHGTLKKVLANIAALQAVRALERAAKPRLQLNTVITKHNASSLHRLIDLAHAAGFFRVRYIELQVFDTAGCRELMVTERQLPELRRSLLLAAQKASACGLETNAQLLGSI